MAQRAQLSVGSKVTSLRVGAVKEFDGEIVSIIESESGVRKFCVVADAQGRSFYRDFHEIKIIEEV